MANNDIAELTWENGQIALHEFGGIFPNGSAKVPAWDRAGDTLESVVQRATISSKEAGPSLADPRGSYGVRNGGSVVASSGGRWASEMNGLVIKKRTRSESEHQCRIKLCSEDDWADMSVCASADAAFCRDTDRNRTVCTLASHESSRSTRTKTTDDDSACNGGSENILDGRAVRCETERSHSARKGRAAAVHNQSERRRRDRINQKMKALQKMVPNASKTDKASMLDEVIEYLKQLQTQVQLMSARSMSQHMMMPFGMQQQLQMSLLARAGMGVGLGMGMGMLNMGNVAAHASAAPQHLASLIHQTPPVSTSAPTFVAPPLLVPPSAPQQAKPDPGNSSLVPFQDPYNAFLGQSMNMEMYNRMTSLYGQQMNQAPKTSSHM